MYKKIKKINLRTPVECSDDLGDAQTHENVDRVIACNTADRVVCIFLLYGGLAGGEQIRQTGAQGEKCDGRHCVLQAHQAAKNAGQVVDEGDQYANLSSDMK